MIIKSMLQSGILIIQGLCEKEVVQEIILPKDIADGVFSCIGILTKSTGNTINVDGGMTNAFVG